MAVLRLSSIFLTESLLIWYPTDILPTLKAPTAYQLLLKKLHIWSHFSFCLVLSQPSCNTLLKAANSILENNALWFIFKRVMLSPLDFKGAILSLKPHNWSHFSFRLVLSQPSCNAFLKAANSMLENNALWFIFKKVRLSQPGFKKSICHKTPQLKSL